MEIVKERIFLEGSPTTVVYPETSADQVMNKELFEHNITITGTAAFDNTLECDIQCIILCKNSAPVNFFKIVKGSYTGICTMYKKDGTSATSMDIKGTAGKFNILDGSPNNEEVELVFDYTDGTTNNLTFRVNTFTDVVTNVYNRSINLDEQ